MGCWEAPLAILREMRASEWLSITPSSYSAFAARSFARFMRRNRQFEVDAFVISGDIATSAKKADLDVAHAFLFGAADSTHKPRMKLESAEFPTIIIPGNHDRFGFLHFPGVALFDDLFPNWEGGTRVISKSIRRGGVTLKIVGVDLSLDHYLDGLSTFGYVGQGRAYEDRIAELFSASNSDPAYDFLIWVVHFPPKFAGIRESLGLINEDMVVEAAFQCGVKALLCGHTHESRQYKISDGGRELIVACAGSALQHYSIAPAEFCHYLIHTSPGNNKLTLSSTTFALKESGDFSRA